MTDQRNELTTGERLEKWVSDNGLYWVIVPVAVMIVGECVAVLLN